MLALWVFWVVQLFSWVYSGGILRSRLDAFWADLLLSWVLSILGLVLGFYAVVPMLVTVTEVVVTDNGCVVGWLLE